MNDEPKSKADPRTDRRQFIAAATALTAAALTGFPAAAAPQLTFADSACGEQTRPRVLVAYASKYATTGEVALAIAKQICAAGAAADVHRAEQVKSLEPYHAVIVGGAAHNFNWMAEAELFVKHHADRLAQLPTAYFITGLQMVPEQPAWSKTGKPPKDEDPQARLQRVRAYLDPILKKYPQVKPLDIAVFRGAIFFDRLNGADRAVMKTMGFVEGDFRDWDAIKAWAQTVTPQLLKK